MYLFSRNDVFLSVVTAGGGEGGLFTDRKLPRDDLMVSMHSLQLLGGEIWKHHRDRQKVKKKETNYK